MSFKPRKILIFQHSCFYYQLKLHAQLGWAQKKCYNLWSRLPVGAAVTFWVSWASVRVSVVRVTTVLSIAVSVASWAGILDCMTIVAPSISPVSIVSGSNEPSVSAETSVFGGVLMSNNLTGWLMGNEVSDVVTNWLVSSFTSVDVVRDDVVRDGSETFFERIVMFFNWSWKAWRLPNPWKDIYSKTCLKRPLKRKTKN